jgi:general secretion pathway protein J
VKAVRHPEQGFTLVELLVSLVIFSMLSAAGVALLSFSVRAQDIAGERLEQIGDFRRFSALATSDFAQAAQRISRDESGALRPAFVGGTGQAEPVSVTLVRRGWENVDGSNRSSLQKVQYRLQGDRLERVAYRFVDGSAPLDAVTLVDGVRSLRLRYRDPNGDWRERWDPTRPTDMPVAVEMVLDVERGGSVRQLFLVGTGA